MVLEARDDSLECSTIALVTPAEPPRTPPS